MSERDPSSDGSADIVVKQGITMEQIEEAVLLEDCCFYDPVEFRRYMRQCPEAIVFTASARRQPFQKIQRDTRHLLWRLGNDRSRWMQDTVIGLLMGEMDPKELRGGRQVCVLHTVVVSAFETQRRVLDALLSSARETCVNEGWERIDVDIEDANRAYEDPLLDSGFSWLELRRPGKPTRMRWTPPPRE